MIHINAKDNSGTDAMSRYPSENASEEYYEDNIIADQTNFNALRVTASSLSFIEYLQVLTSEKLPDKTLKDDSLKNLMRLIQDGFPEHSQHMLQRTAE